MGSSPPSPPPPPDPYATAQAQGTANKETAIANAWLGNVNEQNPLGSVQYTSGPTHTVGGMEVPTFNRSVQYSPEQQAILDQQQNNQYLLGNYAGQQIDRVGGILGTPFNPADTAPARAATPGGPTYNNAPTAPGLYGVSLNQGYFGGLGDMQRSIDLQGVDSRSGEVQRTLGPTDYADQRKSVEDAMYARLNPQLDLDRASLETRLVNQGFQRGSPAFNTEMDAENRQANDARMQVILAGGAEQSRLAGLDKQAGDFANAATGQAFGMDTASATANNQAIAGEGQFKNAARTQEQQDFTAALKFNNDTTQQQQQFNNAANQQMYDNAMQGTKFNNATQTDAFNSDMSRAAYQNASRAQGIQEAQASRNQPINEISALMSGSQVQPLQFQPYQYQPMAPAPIAESVYNSANIASKNYATSSAAAAQQSQGMFSLAGSIIGGLFSLSDRRLKTNIVDLGVKLANGLKLYAYDIFGNRTVGVMADEVERVTPSAVVTLNSGFKAVNYSMVMK